MRSICSLSMMPLRGEARHGSEMVSMLLFGEAFEVLESKENWHYVSCEFDEYKGWVRAGALQELESGFWNAYDNEKPAYCQRLTTLTTSTGENILLSPGSRLPLIKDDKTYIGDSEYNLSGASTSSRDLEEIASQFINTPYLWGGRSILGIDCSGFTQVVFKLLDLQLPRDAWQQAEKGNDVNGLGDSQQGDLAFFREDGGKITHVGILLGKNQIIHASEWVRIDRIDESGIFNAQLNKHTLKPCLIKRYLLSTI